MVHKKSTSLICVGPHEDIAHFATDYLQTIMCPHRAQNNSLLCRCNICTQIMQHQSSQVTWIEPASDYVLDDINPVFTTIRYALEQHTHHAFVLNNAESLSVACANRLLKVVEEPPAGYFFIFLTTDYHALLPTIQSRSTILYTTPHHNPPLTGLLAYFLDHEKQHDPAGLDTLLRSEPPSVAQTKQLVHQLAVSINYESYSNPEAVKALIEKAQRNFPQSGGAQHFIRWLFMSIHMAEQVK